MNKKLKSNVIDYSFYVLAKKMGMVLIPAN
jgi:hypothetical protein